MIEHLHEKDLNKFQEFIKAEWNPNHIFLISKEILDFQHKEENNYYSFIIYKSVLGEIESVLGYIYSNESKDSFWLALWKSKGGTTHGLSLLFKLLREKPLFIGAIGISTKAKKLYKSLKWTTAQLSHYYIPNNSILKLKGNHVDAEAVVYDINDSFDFKSNQSNFQPKKDVQYFKNRYLSHPTFKYEFLTIPELDLTFIYRLIHYNNLKTMHVVDLIGDIHNKNVAAPIKWILEKEEIDLFEMMMFDSREIKTDLIIKKEEIIPTYFQPLVLKNINIEIAYKTEIAIPVRGFLGDSDQDRPN
jgi:hypothetical protein